MADHRLIVLLEGRNVGTVTQDQNGRFRFDYQDEWRRDADNTPLSLSMPLAGSTHGHRAAEAFLWGLLPDDERVLKRWARDNHVSPRNPFALLSYVGEECAGAAQFVRPERVEEAATGGDIDWLDEDYMAERIRLLRRDPTAWQTPVEYGQFSLAGAQAKMALLQNDGQWGRPSGRIPTTHIIKPAIEGFDDHDLNEHICLRAARFVGLRAAFSEIAQFGSERAIVIERYDRLRTHDGSVRVHQEDLCQSLGVMPTKKYQNEGGPTPAQIVQLLRSTDPVAAAADSVSGFVDALAYNWLIGGTDAHAKNYSVLLSGRQVRLAPLYDVASALPYPQMDVRRLKLAMSIGGEYRLERIARRHWLRLAKELRLEGDAVVTRVWNLADRVPEAFARVSEDDALRELRTPLPSQLTEVVTARATACIESLRSQ